MKPITVWSKLNKQQDGTFKWEHNHIECGLKRGLYPLPIKPEFKLQYGWKNAQWRRKRGYLNTRLEIITYL